MRRGVPPGHIEHLVTQDFRHPGTNGGHPTRHDEELLLLKEFLKPRDHAFAFSHDDSPFFGSIPLWHPSFTLSALAPPRPGAARRACPWHGTARRQLTVRYGPAQAGLS